MQHLQRDTPNVARILPALQITLHQPGRCSPVWQVDNIPISRTVAPRHAATPRRTSLPAPCGHRRQPRHHHDLIKEDGGHCLLDNVRQAVRWRDAEGAAHREDGCDTCAQNDSCYDRTPAAVQTPRKPCVYVLSKRCAPGRGTASIGGQGG